MLKQLRSGAAGFFAKLLLGLLVLMFVFWGVHGSLNFSQAPALAKVGNEEITTAQFEKEVRILRRSLGADLPPGQSALSGLYRATLNNMIAKSLMMQEADRIGFSVSDDALARQIADNPELKGPSGEFDKVRYQQKLQQDNQTEQEYLDDLRSRLEVSILLKVLGGGGLVPPAYPRILYDIGGETRRVDLAMVKAGSAPASREPQPAEMKTYYDAHKADYLAPEYRSLEFVRIAPASVIGRVTVTRQELFDRYNQRLESLMLPEKRDVVQLLYTTKAEAENAYSMLRSGKTYNDVAQLLPPNNKGSLGLGYMTHEQLPTGGETIFGLGRSEFTPPIESPFGWHVFLVRDIRDRHATPFDDVKKSLEAELRQQKGEHLLTESTEQLEDAIAGTLSLEDAARQAGLPLNRLGPIDRNGLSVDAHPLLSPAADKELLATTFALRAGDTSPMTRQADGGQYVAKVDAVIPPRQKTLDEVRPQVVTAWKEAQRRDAEKAFADILAQKLKAAGSLDAAEKLAETQRIELRRGLIVKRSGSVDGQTGVILPPALTQDIFKQAAGGVSNAHAFGDQGYAIALLRQIDAPPDPTKLAAGDPFAEQLASSGRALQKDYENEIFEQYIEHLKSRYPVTVNEDAFAAMIERP